MGWSISGSITFSPVVDSSGSSIQIDLPIDEREYSDVRQLGQSTVIGPATVTLWEALDDSAIVPDFAYCLITPLEGSADFFVGVYVDRNDADQLAHGFDLEAGGLPGIIRGHQFDGSLAGDTNAISYGAGPNSEVTRVEIRIPSGTARYVATFLRE